MIAFARPTPRRPAPARNFNGLVDSLRPGELTLLAGCPGVGKTSLAAAIADRAVIDRGRSTIFIAPGQSNFELTERILSYRSRVDADRIRGNTASRDERFRFLAAADALSRGSLWFADNPVQRLDDVLAAAWAAKRCAALSLLIVDSLQMLVPIEPLRTRSVRIADTARRLRRLAQEFDVAVLVVNQIRRSYEDGPPLLKHAGAPGRIADRVWLVDASQGQRVRLLQRKPRRTSISLNWRPGLGLFEDSAK